ncbi:MAG: PAS domain-containing protein, partial [Holosporales bacterium]|nr:PAS domain-containing protein [Holosporales bacterium]
MIKLIGDLCSQIVIASNALGVYLYIFLGFVCITGILVFGLHVVCKKNKLLNYYVNVIRTISKSFSDYLDIIAMNGNDDVIYTTRPDLYITKQEFSRIMAEKVVSATELQTFLNMLDAKRPHGVVLSGSGTGLQNHFRKWIATCSFVKATESMIKEDVSIVTIADVSKYLDQIDMVTRNHEKLEKFLDNFPLGIFYINNNGIIIGANITFANLLNVSRERVIGCSLQDFIDGFKIVEIPQMNHSFVQFKPRYTQKFDAVLIKSELSTTSVLHPWIVVKMDKAQPTVKKNGF